VDHLGPLISAAQLAAAIDSPQLRIIDCRFNLLEPDAGREAYVGGHIPGAVYADLDKDLAAPVTPDSGRHPLPTAATLASTFGKLGIAEDTFVVVYDNQGGAVAARGWWLLRWLGHNKVALLDGGLAAWTAQGSSLEEGVTAVESQDFVAERQNGWTIEVEEIAAAIENGSDLRLIDARAAARFDGSQEPIDTAAGHIPGTVNLAFDRSLDGDGRWRPMDELRQMWSELLSGDSTEPWSVMCGSGVTACHLAISAKLAGYPQPRLYVGSWSEWIRDPRRPISTGPA